MISALNNLETLGALLKDARKARNLTIEKLSELTKIKPSNLEAMEEDRFEQLAAPTYAKGFLKIVARPLELNEAELLKLYDERYPQKTKQVIFICEKPSTRKPRPRRFSSKLVFAAAAAATLLGIGFWAASSDKKEEPRPANSNVILSEAKDLGKPVTTAPAVRVQIEALSDVWVKVIADEKLIFENTVRQNQKEEWPAQEKMALRLGRPSDVVLTVNGKPVDLTGQRKPVNLLITPDEVRQHD